MNTVPETLRSVPRLRAGGLIIGRLTRREWAELMAQQCLATRSDHHRRPFIVFSANGQVVAKCLLEPVFKALVEQADLIDADGQPLVLASRIWCRAPLPERVATTDFFHDAARIAEEKGLSFYFLASTKERIRHAVSVIKRTYPRLRIVGYRDGYFDTTDVPAVLDEIRTAAPDVLWVGLGVPKQEEFVLEHREQLRGVGWIKTCGGLFDYFSPDIKRAPRWMQGMGLEWLFRAVQEPRKYASRYLRTNPSAAWALLTQTGDLD